MSYNLGTASGRIEIDGSGASRGFGVAQTAANGFFGAIQAKVNQVEQLGRRMQIVGAAGVAGFGIAVKAASSFEAQMSGVQAVTNATGEEFDSLKDKALQLGADTAYSASEAALAIEELAKAGIPIEDILNGAADATVALAAAGGVALPEAATIAANAMNQFDLSAKELPKVADILAGVANTSASDVSSIGQSLAQTGAVANLAGLSFRDTAIALGEMADAGIQGSDAGTSLKTFLNNLIPTTTAQSNEFARLGLETYDLADAQKTLQKIGLKGTYENMEQVNIALGKYVEGIGKGTVGTQKNQKEVRRLLIEMGGLNNQFFDAKGNVKNLGQLQGVLSGALKGMTRQQKLASLELLFGADAMRASAILSNAGAKGYREFSKAVGETSAAEVAAVRLDNLKGSTEALKGSLETAFITIGNVLLPVITKFVDGLTFLVNVFNNLPAPIQKAIAILAAIVTVMLLVIGTIFASITALAAFVLQWFALRIITLATTWLLTFTKAMRAGTAISAAFTLANSAANKSLTRTVFITKLASKAMLLFGKAALFASKAVKALLAFALGPWGLAIIAIVVALVLLYKKSETFREAVHRLIAAIKDGLLRAWEAMQPAIRIVIEYLKELGAVFMRDVMPVLRQVGALILGHLMAAFQEIWATIQSDLIPALKELADNFQQNILPALKDLWTAVQPVVKVIGTVLVAAIIIWIKTLAEVYKFILGKVIPVLAKFVGFIAGPAIRVLTAWIQGVIGVVTGIVKVFSGLIKIVQGIFTGDWQKVWDGAKQIFQGFGDILKGLFKMAFAGIIGVVRSFGRQILNWFKGIFDSLFGGGGESGPLTPLVNFFRNAFNIILSVVTTVMQAVYLAFATPLKLIFSIFSWVFSTFGPIVLAVFKLIWAIIRLGWTIIKGIFLVALAVIVGIIRAQFNLIMNIIRAVWSRLKPIIMPPLNAVKNFIKAAWTAIKSATSATWSAIKAVISVAVALLKTIITNRFNEIKAIAKTVWNLVKETIKSAWTNIKTVVREGLDAIGRIMDGLYDKVVTPVINLGTNLYNAGREIIEKLASGIESAIDKVTSAVDKVTGAVGKFLPGSPVREGPLKVLNRGRAGRQIVEMIASGIRDTGELKRSMDRAARLVAGYQFAATGSVALGTAYSALTPSAVGPGVLTAPIRPPAARKRGGGGGSGKLRMIEGRLRIDPDGRAWVEGIVEDVVDEREDYERRGKGGGRD